MIGVWRSPLNAVEHPGTPACSIGPDLGTLGTEATFGTVRIKAKPTTSPP